MEKLAPQDPKRKRVPRKVRKTVAVRIDPRVWEEAKRKAKALGLTLCDWVEMWVTLGNLVATRVWWREEEGEDNPGEEERKPLILIEHRVVRLRRGRGKRFEVRTLALADQCYWPGCPNPPKVWLSFQPDPRRKLLIRRAYCELHARRYRQDAVTCEPWSSDAHL